MVSKLPLAGGKANSTAAPVPTGRCSVGRARQSGYSLAWVRMSVRMQVTAFVVMVAVVACSPDQPHLADQR